MKFIEQSLWSRLVLESWRCSKHHILQLECNICNKYSTLGPSSLAREKIRILPSWQVGFAKMSWKLWASPKYLYEMGTSHDFIISRF
jgi:hypothetical protein